MNFLIHAKKISNCSYNPKVKCQKMLFRQFSITQPNTEKQIVFFQNVFSHENIFYWQKFSVKTNPPLIKFVLFVASQPTKIVRMLSHLAPFSRCCFSCLHLALPRLYLGSRPRVQHHFPKFIAIENLGLPITITKSLHLLYFGN